MDREEKFRTSQQAALKLDIALERLLDEGTGAELSPAWEQTYRAYLKQRAYPALLRLAGQGDAMRLRRFLRLGLVQQRQCRQALEQAGTADPEIRLLLMGLDAPPRTPIVSDREGAARRAWEVTGQSLAQMIPYLHLFFSDLQVETVPDHLYSGTDGLRVCLQVSHILQCFGEGTLRELYLHMMLHILYGHLVMHLCGHPDERPRGQLLRQPPGYEQPYSWELWDISCDVAAWALRGRAFDLPLGLRGGESHVDRLLGLFPESVAVEDPSAVCLYLQEDLKKRAEAEDILKCLPGDFHGYWYGRDMSVGASAALAFGEDGSAGAGSGSSPGADGGEQAAYLRRIRAKMAQADAYREQRLRMPRRHRFGFAPGSRRDLLELRKQGRYDFRKYLRRFSSVREEIQTDEDSFDYIYYTLGLERYGNMPLIEPLEYMEAQRVEELVIAIDTSSSCSLALVRRFLEVTRELLTRRENFFRRMNVHIIQCDSMIQDHQTITCVEDWQRYERELAVVGRGGTDFTPVFRLVERLRRERVLKKLKGLLYFTDGDGIYPRQPTDYETAFVFAGREFREGEQAGQVPDWIIRLCLDRVEE